MCSAELSGSIKLRAFAIASASAVFLAFLSVLGQLGTRELSVVPTLFFRFLASGLVILAVLRGEAWQTLARIGRPEWLRVGSVLISQFLPLPLS